MLEINWTEMKPDETVKLFLSPPAVPWWHITPIKSYFVHLSSQPVKKRKRKICIAKLTDTNINTQNYTTHSLITLGEGSTFTNKLPKEGDSLDRVIATLHHWQHYSFSNQPIPVWDFQLNLAKLNKNVEKIGKISELENFHNHHGNSIFRHGDHIETIPLDTFNRYLRLQSLMYTWSPFNKYLSLQFLTIICVARNPVSFTRVIYT